MESRPSKHVWVPNETPIFRGPQTETNIIMVRKTSTSPSTISTGCCLRRVTELRGHKMGRNQLLIFYLFTCLTDQMSIPPKTGRHTGLQEHIGTVYRFYCSSNHLMGKCQPSGTPLKNTFKSCGNV